MDREKQPGLQIHQIFLSEVRFAHREDALQLPANSKVDVKITVGISSAVATEGPTHGIIKVALTSNDDDKSLYRFHLEMIGVVGEVEGEANMEVRDYLTVNGPAMLYPFVREALANITARGRFGPVWLRPFNLKAAAVGVAEGTT